LAFRELKGFWGFRKDIDCGPVIAHTVILISCPEGPKTKKENKIFLKP
jgi:hypothetical protein